MVPSSLFDLGAYMGDEGIGAEPARSFAVARDVVRHRVEPALSSLESALKESRVKFVVKSLIGAASVALGPITPATAVSGSLALGAQTIDYAFARSKWAWPTRIGLCQAESPEPGRTRWLPRMPGRCERRGIGTGAVHFCFRRFLGVLTQRLAAGSSLKSALWELAVRVVCVRPPKVATTRFTGTMMSILKRSKSEYEILPVTA